MFKLLQIILTSGKYEALVRAIISELHVYTKIFSLEFANYILKSVAILSGNAHHVRLDRRLHFGFGIFNELDHFFGFILRNALLDCSLLPNCSTRGGLYNAVGQGLQRDPAPNQLLLQNVVHISQLGFVLGGEH
jgi:hypothetical protein